MHVLRPPPSALYTPHRTRVPVFFLGSPVELDPGTARVCSRSGETSELCYKCERKRERGGEMRERKRQTDRQTEIERQRQRDRDTETRDRDKQRDRDRDRQTGRQADRQAGG